MEVNGAEQNKNVADFQSTCCQHSHYQCYHYTSFVLLLLLDSGTELENACSPARVTDGPSEKVFFNVKMPHFSLFDFTYFNISNPTKQSQEAVIS